jgi:hypothetical protein
VNEARRLAPAPGLQGVLAPPLEARVATPAQVEPAKIAPPAPLVAKKPAAPVAAPAKIAPPAPPVAKKPAARKPAAKLMKPVAPARKPLPRPHGR